MSDEHDPVEGRIDERWPINTCTKKMNVCFCKILKSDTRFLILD